MLTRNLLQNYGKETFGAAEELPYTRLNNEWRWLEENNWNFQKTVFHRNFMYSEVRYTSTAVRSDITKYFGKCKNDMQSRVNRVGYYSLYNRHTEVLRAPPPVTARTHTYCCRCIMNMNSAFSRLWTLSIGCLYYVIRFMPEKFADVTTNKWHLAAGDFFKST